MYRHLAIALLLGCAPACAQMAQSPDLASNTQQTVTTTPASQVILQDGLQVVLRNNKRISSEDAQVGDQIDFVVAKPVKVDELVVIPGGAPAKGHVALTEKKRRKGHGGQLGITIEQVRLATGESAQLRAKDERKAGGEMGSNMTTVAVMSEGLALPALPLLLLQHGDDMVLLGMTTLGGVVRCPRPGRGRYWWKGGCLGDPVVLTPFGRMALPGHRQRQNAGLKRRGRG